MVSNIHFVDWSASPGLEASSVASPARGTRGSILWADGAAYEVENPGYAALHLGRLLPLRYGGSIAAT